MKWANNYLQTGGGGVVVVSGGNDDPLLKSLGFRSGTSSPAESVGRGGRKRPSSEEAGGSQDESNVAPLPAKRASVSLLDTLPPSTSVSSSGNSKLCEKNRMLASLLAQRPSTPATIPPVPASIISATPQVSFLIFITLWRFSERLFILLHRMLSTFLSKAHGFFFFPLPFISPNPSVFIDLPLFSYQLVYSISKYFPYLLPTSRCTILIETFCPSKLY